MSKTNHRVNRERPEKDSESAFHRKRRVTKKKVEALIDIYKQGENNEDYEVFLDDPEFESFSKMRKKTGRA